MKASAAASGSGKKAAASSSAKKAPAKKPQSGKNSVVAKAAAKKAAAAAKKAKAADPRISTAPRNFGIGCALQPKRDLSRFVRWPQYIRIQRQAAILKRRLKVPPAINQFRRTLDSNGARALLRLLCKIRPETKVEKRTRLRAEAVLLAAVAPGAERDIKKISAKPIVVKFGINHVMALVESRKARLVVIAHDVDPIELVVCLPALCRKMGVPYVILKGKSRLGAVVHKRTATALAVCDVHPNQEPELEALVKLANAQFNDKFDDIRRTWGGGIMGRKSLDKVKKHKKALAKEASGLRK